MISILFNLLFSATFGHAHQAATEICASQLKANPLQAAQVRAAANLARMDELVKTFTTEEQAYFQKIAAAARAAVEKHHRLYENSKNWKNLNIQRHLAILNSIAQFDEDQPRFALYKIKRAIEGGYSLREYVNCR